MTFNFNDWLSQMQGQQGQGQNPNLDYGGPANSYDYYGLNQQGQGQNSMNNFLTPANPDIGATTNPVFSPDINGGSLGSGSGTGTGSHWYDQPTGGTYTDEFGNQQPNTPISHLNPGSGPYGGNIFNGQQTDFGPVGNGSGSTGTGSGNSLTGGGANGLPKVDGNSVIPNATDNYFNGMLNDMRNQMGGSNAHTTLTPNLPGSNANAANAAGSITGAGAAANTPKYGNLYGSDIAGSQLGFNELNGKQFTDNSDAFKSVFGSTQGTGQGNNYNWNVYPQFSADQLDPQAQAQIIQIAQANPQYDFEPTMINGKWVLASRARDISQQKSLLAPVLPPTNPTGGGGGGAARSTSGGGYTKFTGPQGPQGPQGPTQAEIAAAQQKLGNADKLGAGLVGSVVRAMQNQQFQNTSPWSTNSSYQPVTGTGAGYYPTPTADERAAAQQAAQQKLMSAIGGANAAMNGAAVYTPNVPGQVPAAPASTPIGTIRGEGDNQEIWNGQQWVPLSFNITY